MAIFLAVTTTSPFGLNRRSQALIKFGTNVRVLVIKENVVHMLNGILRNKFFDFTN